MHGSAIAFLIMSIVVVPLVAKRTGLQRGIARPIISNPVVLQPQPIKQSDVSKNGIVSKLDALLQQTVLDDKWYKAVNDLVIDLVLFDKPLSIEYLKKIQTKTASVAEEKAKSQYLPTQMPISSPMPALTGVSEQKTIPKSLPHSISSESAMHSQPAVPKLSKSEIVAQLDEKLRSAIVDDAWYDQVNDLIFDLALIDRNASQAYLKKIRAKIVPASVSQPLTPDLQATIAPIVPSEKKGAAVASIPTESMKKGFPPAPPAGGMQKGTLPPPPPAPLAGGLKKGGTPPPPPGPMIKGKKASAPQEKASAVAPVKGSEPLSVTVSYGGPQLAKRSNEEVIELFNTLLDALATRGDFWDSVKKEPKSEWRNKIDTVRKALSDPKRNLTMNAAQIIENRIKQVRAEKTQEGLQKQESAEKEKQKAEAPEYTQEELITQIEALKKRADPSDFKWLIEFQGAIKKLDKINYEKAVEYEAEFIKKFPGQKQFLPKKKEVAIIKELTEEERLITTIDSILNEKPVLWAIKVREPIQALYDINPVRGLEYQEKYIVATQQATGKADKPFLKMKE